MLITTDELSKTIWDLILQEINPGTRKILKSMSYKDPEFEQGFIQGLAWASISAITTKPAEYKDFAEFIELYERTNTDWNSLEGRSQEEDRKITTQEFEDEIREAYNKVLEETKRKESEFSGAQTNLDASYWLNDGWLRGVNWVLELLKKVDK